MNEEIMTDSEKLDFLSVWAGIVIEEDEDDLNNYGQGYREAAEFILRVLVK